MEFQIELEATFRATTFVEAESLEEALELVDRRDFEPTAPLEWEMDSKSIAYRCPECGDDLTPDHEHAFTTTED